MSRSLLAFRLSLLCLMGTCLLPIAAEEKKPAQAAGTADPKSPTGPVVDSKTFVIGAEDVLVVRVWRDPEVSGAVTVRPDGKITLQLIGEIQAAGLTPEALTQVIYDGMSKLKQLDRSEVTVSVSQVNSRKYFIQGEVARAGAFPLLVPTRVLEAVGHSGGFKEFANEKKILIIHPDGTRDRFNYKEVIHGKKLEQNILLQPGDLIIVP
jgi:polysaccharide export outer membrane protein